MERIGEVFEGNIYISIPAFLNGQLSYQQFCKTTLDKSKPDDDFLTHITERVANEISGEVHKSLKRFYIGDYNLACFDQFECNQEKECYENASVYLTIHEKTCLAVVTILMRDTQVAASQLLDRISQNNLIIQHSNGEVQSLENFLSIGFSLSILSSAAKVCLSTRRQIDSNILPYYFANETFNSTDMQAQITSDAFKSQIANNIAQYNSSDIYVGKSTLLRIDRREGDHVFPQLSSDSVLIFIIESLLFKEAAVLRTNNRILQAIGKKNLIALDTMEGITSEYAVTMPFWDIKIFNYLTAQQLANKINTGFGIDQHFKLYEKNQQFLQHKINIRQGIKQESENKVLYLIAIILFVFEIAPYMFNLFNRLLSGKWLTKAELFATFGAGASTALMAIVLVLLIKKRKKRND